MSIKLNEPVVVNVAPMPLPAPLGCVYVIVPPVVVAKSVVVAAFTDWWKLMLVVTRLSTYSLVAASASCAGYARLLIQVLAVNTMLPAGFKLMLPVPVLIVRAPLVGLMLAVFTLPAITLAAADTNPPVNTFAAVTSAVLVIEPVALIRPPVNILPPVTLPLTLTTVPVTLAALIMVVAIMLLPLTLAALKILPVAVISPLAVRLPPFTLAADVTLPAADTAPPVNKLPPVTLPVLLNEVNTPTEVILACALAVTYWAVPAVSALPADTAYVALATVPVTLAPAKLLNKLPLPMM